MIKTSHSRYRCEAAITVRHLNDKKTFIAKMLNYSNAGMYFEASFFFEEGSILYTRMTDGLVVHSDPEPDEKPHKVRFGEVRWCKEIGSNGHCCYGIGIKYC